MKFGYCVWGLGFGVALVGSGCALSKDESTLSRLHDEMANKKQADPPGFYKEDKVGVRYYPDAAKVQSRQFDENGSHVIEVVLNTNDAVDKVRAFYERELGGSAADMGAKQYMIRSGNREVSFGEFGSDVTITIHVYQPSR